MIKLAIVLLVLFANSANSHEQGGVNYHDWKNSKQQGCCNNRDCKPLEDHEERVTSAGTEVLVRGVGVAKGQVAWCPVTSQHYLSKGNAADSTRSHSCVTDHYGATTPCTQFICYQPKPGV